MSSAATVPGDESNRGPDASVDRSDEAEESTVGQSLSQDVAFEMLSSRRRRHVLHHLRQRGGSSTLKALSRQLAAWENDVAVREVTYEERVRLYTALRQAHLPKMDESGIVEFDPDRGTVELTDRATELDVYLDVVPHDEIPWSVYYAGLGGICTVFAVLIAVGVTPFSALPAGAGAAIIALLLAGSGLAHVAYDDRMRIGGEGPPPE